MGGCSALKPEAKVDADASGDVEEDGRPDVASDMMPDGDLDASGSPEAPPDADIDRSGGNDVSCIPDCPELGRFRCASNSDAGVPRQVQICSMIWPGCLQWLNTTTCGEEEVCCEGSCRSLETASNCFAPPGFDYYVDAQRGTDEQDAGPSAGTRQRPFRTITRATHTAAAMPRGARRIFVAAGQYDTDLGETFPLVLRRGASIHGAGSNFVTIRGAGEFDHRAAGGVYNGTYQVTLVAGDDTATTTVAGVTILGTADAPQPDHFGVFCDRGNVPESGELVGATVLENAVIGAGYYHGILAVSSDGSDGSAASGCKLRMFETHVTRALYGVVAAGCRPGERGFPVSLHIGDTNRGNWFSSIGSALADSAGILIQHCVTHSSVRDSQFINSSGGLTVDQQGDPGSAVNAFIFERNFFSNLWHAGMWLVGNAASATLHDNSFRGVSSGSTATRAAIALWVEGRSGYLPLKKARRNTFLGNDIAVHVTSPNDPVTPALTFDLGTPSDPGENAFLCNSRVATAAGEMGGDLWFYVPGGIFSLAGNVWDHYPPTTVNLAKVNGADVTFELSPAPNLDTSGGRSGAMACPPNRIPGPGPGDGGGAR